MNLLSVDLTESVRGLIEIHERLEKGEQILFTTFVKLGPHFAGVRIDLPYWRIYHPGYVRVRCEITKASLDGSANFVQWISTDEVDGLALLHFAVSVMQTRMWQITIIEKPAP